MPMPSAFPIFFGRPNFNFGRPKYFRFFRKKIGRPKKNLVVQKFFFIIFSYENDVFGSSKIFLAVQIFLDDQNFLDGQIFFGRPKLKFGWPK